MAEQQATESGNVDRVDEPIPIMQELFDNIWLLFLVSVVIVLVSYILWGIIDLVNIPVIQ
jgi:hypothetical protein